MLDQINTSSRYIAEPKGRGSGEGRREGRKSAMSALRIEELKE